MDAVLADTHDALRARDDRLRWHCRRALLELDIVFQRYWALLQEGQVLPADEAESLTILLEHEDYDLWDLVSGRKDSELAQEKKLLEHLRTL